MEKAYVAANRETREALSALVRGLSDADVARDAGGGWTVGTILAHLAFWDQRTIVLLRRWKRCGVSASLVDQEILNETLLPLCRAVPPRTAAELAMAAAGEADREIESLTDGLVAEIEALGDPMRLRRHIHRQMHIGQIRDICCRSAAP